MNTTRKNSWCGGVLKLALLTAIAVGSAARAQLPVSGRPVAGMTNFDTIMSDFMTARGITAGVLGISRGGRIEYLRGFGWIDRTAPSADGTPLPENALMRTASVVKPITAAAVRQLALEGGLGGAGLNTRAFNGLVIGFNGVLTVSPAPTLGDARYADITLAHLILHQGGFNRLVSPPGDVMGRSREIAAALGIASPPSVTDILRYTLGFPLQWAPGTVSNLNPPNLGTGAVTSSDNGSPTTITTAAPHNLLVGDTVTISGHSIASVNTTSTVIAVPSANSFQRAGVASSGGTGGIWTKDTDPYSNVGYAILGEVLQARAPGGYLGYLQSRILSPAAWIPATEFAPARSLPPDRHRREPLYISGSTRQSVFDNEAPIDIVSAADGGFFIEGMLAHGGIIASAPAILRFANQYHAGYVNDDFGRPIDASRPMQGYAHSGRLDGTNTWVQQRPDGIVFYLALNRTDFGNPDFAQALATEINNALNNPGGFSWPGTSADGFWVTVGPENPNAGYGGYHSTYQGFQSALDRTSDGSHLRLRPGAQSWSGTMAKRLRLDAPEGPVTIGRSN